MDYSSIQNLINLEEDALLYQCQNSVIENKKLSVNDKLIRLSILQTMPPIEDWENAAEILRNYYKGLKDYNLLVATYIAITAFEMMRYPYVEHFLSILSKEINNSNLDFYSVAEFLKAEYLYEKGGNQKIVCDLLKKSISYSTKYVMNYLKLSDFYEGDQKKQLIKRALINVKKLFGVSNASVYSVEEQIDPLSFFNEKIVRIEMNDIIYRNLLKSVKE